MFSANAAEEFFVRRSPLYEVVGQIGMWGTLINGIQAAGLEHGKMRDVTWNGSIGEFRSPLSLIFWPDLVFEAGLLLAYTTALFILYTTAPIIYRLASSVFYNLNLLSANFFGLLFGKLKYPLPRYQVSDHYPRFIPLRMSSPNSHALGCVVTRWVYSTIDHSGCILWRSL